MTSLSSTTLRAYLGSILADILETFIFDWTVQKVPKGSKTGTFQSVFYVFENLTISQILCRNVFGQRGNIQENCILLDLSNGLPQKLNVYICLLLLSMTCLMYSWTCIFADLSATSSNCLLWVDSGLDTV